jgi:2,4-dienoyl-CoA reductase-like NADH-dependent reductase (Old Yellow Enzyme family)
MNHLFTPYNLAGLDLANRIVMAPMTRARAANGVADVLTERYYSQRATAGLIVSEGIAVSREGTGHLFTPGLYTDDQGVAWRRVTDAVHAAGGRIVAQLWHVGRNSHVSLQAPGGAPVAPVARRARDAQTYAWIAPGVPGKVAASEPRAAVAGDMAALVGDFVAAARRAMQAGFDGVEIHAANGDLFEQFINGELNTRDDRYGGSIANRLHLLLDTVDAVGAAIGARHIGVRIAPFGRLYDLQAYDDEAATWLALAEELGQRDLAYVHLGDQRILGLEVDAGFFAAFRLAYPGTLIVAGGFNQDSAEAALSAGTADLIAFGQPFIANPDLVARMEHGWPLAEADRATVYGLHGEHGYTDYPFHTHQEAAHER